jgi:hypothetical protein
MFTLFLITHCQIVEFMFVVTPDGVIQIKSIADQTDGLVGVVRDYWRVV